MLQFSLLCLALFCALLLVHSLAFFLGAFDNGLLVDIVKLPQHFGENLHQSKS